MALIDIIGKDKTLKQKENNEKLLSFKSLATLFDENLSENIYLTSLELDDKYDTQDASLWKKFLNHEPVREYINGFLDELSSKQASRILSSEEMKPNVALKVKTEERLRKGKANENIVVLFLPQKEYILND